MISYGTKTTSSMWSKWLAWSLTISCTLNNHCNEICGNVAVSKHAQILEDMELEPRKCADDHKSNGQLLTVMTYMSSMSISWLWYLCAFSKFSDLSYMSIILQHTNSLDPQPAWTICSWTCQPSVSRCYCGRCIQTNVTRLGSTCLCCICQTSPNPCCPCLH
jgi:hypothetical protein